MVDAGETVTGKLLTIHVPHLHHCILKNLIRCQVSRRLWRIKRRLEYLMNYTIELTKIVQLVRLHLGGRRAKSSSA
ncbi:hypothetical protein ACLOJK_023344 [Asimina triloba]